jgi:long-chain acyl-CoA synthetase
VVKAFIVPNPDRNADEAEIIAWAKDNMSSYKCPVHIEFRETLPTLPTGKLLRRMLHEESEN